MRTGLLRSSTSSELGTGTKSGEGGVSPSWCTNASSSSSPLYRLGASCAMSRIVRAPAALSARRADAAPGFTATPNTIPRIPLIGSTVSGSFGSGTATVDRYIDV